MSRIGQQPIKVPAGVTVTWQSPVLTVKGPKGTLRQTIAASLQIRQEAGVLRVILEPPNPELGALHGLQRSLVANMLTGVVQGYSKELEIQGVGFKAALQGRKLVFSLGYSAPVALQIPEGIEVKVIEGINLTVTGADKQLVGDLAARIKSFYPAEPYKGKGIRFKGEYVRRKVGKTVA